VTRVFSGDEKECTKRGYCQATIISCMPEMKSRWLLAEEVEEKKAAIWDVVEKKRERENVTTMREIEGGHAKKRKYIVAKGQRDDDAFINSDNKKYSNY
jgi:hypothetical protein